MASVARRKPFAPTLAAYETAMLKHGFGKVRESLDSLDLFVSGSPRKRAVMHGVRVDTLFSQSIERGRVSLVAASTARARTAPDVPRRW